MSLIKKGQKVWYIDRHNLKDINNGIITDVIVSKYNNYAIYSIETKHGIVKVEDTFVFNAKKECVKALIPMLRSTINTYKDTLKTFKKKTLYFDLDGVLRDLTSLVWKDKEPSSWYGTIDDLSIIDIINDDLDILLNAPPTKYYKTIINELDEINILTAQPVNWRKNTEKWINKYFGNIKYNIIFVETFDEKERFLSVNDYLIDDYPYFKDCSNIIILDHLYNRFLKGKRISNISEMQAIIRQFK